MSVEGIAGLNVSRETMVRLETYLELLAKWNPKINLVSKSTLDHAWTRHFVDSAQLLELAPDDAKIWIDMGSGGGFPGLVIAIIGAELRPGLSVTLMESDQRKCAFLRNVLRETGVAAQVLSKRIEQIDPIGADVISARALAPLPVLLGFAVHHGAPNLTALFPKGESWKSEVEAAEREWRFQHEVWPSKTNPEAVVLRIKEIEHV